MTRAHVAAMLLAFATVGARAADADDAKLPVVRRLRGINILKTHNDAWHEHGGPPAKVYQAWVNFETDGRRHSIEIKHVAMLLDHCDKPRRDDRVVRTVTGLAIHDGTRLDPSLKGKTKLTTPSSPRELSMQIWFDGMTTREACGIEIEVVVDGSASRFQLPYYITRIEPDRSEL